MNAPHLALFFTGSNSLRTWDEAGILEREVALYRALMQRGCRVSFVTYGEASDLDFAERLPGIAILCNRWNMPLRLYSLFLSYLHRQGLSDADVFKTNQTFGSQIALRAARALGKPLIARCGFMWSEFAERREGPDGKETRRAKSIERRVFRAAERVVVTTPAMRDYAAEHYRLNTDKVRVVPNYVLTEQFSPKPGSIIPNQVCCVGRLDDQKNLPALVEACSGLPLRLVVVGEGPLRQELERIASEKGVDLSLPGRLPQAQVVEVLQQSAIFALPSKWEGHPKALLEAMSCGLPVVASDAPGVGEVLRAEETGLVCGTDPASIRTALERLLGDRALRQRLGGAARRYVLDTCSLERVADLEMQLLLELTALPPGVMNSR